MCMFQWVSSLLFLLPQCFQLSLGVFLGAKANNMEVSWIRRGNNKAPESSWIPATVLGCHRLRRKKTPWKMGAPQAFWQTYWTYDRRVMCGTYVYHYGYPTLPSSQVSRIVAGCRTIRTNKNEYMNLNIWVTVLLLHFAIFFLDWTCGASLGWCGDPNVSGLLGFGHWKQSLAFRGATVKFVQFFLVRFLGNSEQKHCDSDKSPVLKSRKYT